MQFEQIGTTSFKFRWS